LIIDCKVSLYGTAVNDNVSYLFTVHAPRNGVASQIELPRGLIRALIGRHGRVRFGPHWADRAETETAR
jgi:hypothetical protein